MPRFDGLFVLALGTQLLACPSGETARTGTVAPSSSAAPAPIPSLVPNAGVAHNGAAIEEPAAIADSASSRPKAASPDNADIDRLKRCCDHFDQVGRKKGQEGTGLIGLSSLCEEIVSALRDGERPPVSSSDWDGIHAIIRDKSVSQGCRTLLLSFENR